MEASEPTTEIMVNLVTEWACWNTQTESAKPVIDEPMIEIVCPTQTMTNERNPAFTMPPPLPAGRTTAHPRPGRAGRWRPAARRAPPRGTPRPGRTAPPTGRRRSMPRGRWRSGPGNRTAPRPGARPGMHRSAADAPSERGRTRPGCRRRRPPSGPGRPPPGHELGQVLERQVDLEERLVERPTAP